MDDVQKIKTSELRDRRLFKAAQDGILILDAQTGTITDVNPFLINMLGYSREEFIQKKLWEVGAFQDVKASNEAFKALQMDEYIRYEDLPRPGRCSRIPPSLGRFQNDFRNHIPAQQTRKPSTVSPK
jgi:PAS domain-containing protein